MARTDEILANMGVVYLEGDILAWRYIDFLSIEVKYHWESQRKKCHYQ